MSTTAASTHTCRTIATQSIHTYFDVCPESSDGRHVCWFQFDGPLLRQGTVIIGQREGDAVVRVHSCTGNAHSGAHQGWLDNEHCYFSANNHVHVADLDGRIVQRVSGAVDTIDQRTRRGLFHSAGWRSAGGNPAEEACFRVDLDDGRTHQLLNRQQAWDLIAQHVDLHGVDQAGMTFKHTKWSPDGSQWFVVFTNESSRRGQSDIPRIKVIIAADPDGTSLRFIGSFGHHPIWHPDGKSIFAFDVGGGRRLLQWSVAGGDPTVLATMAIEGHPSVSPDGMWAITDGHFTAQDMSVVRQHLVTGQRETLATAAWPEVAWQTVHPPRRVCHAHPVYSADGQRIYFNAAVDESPELRVISLEQ